MSKNKIALRLRWKILSVGGGDSYYLMTLAHKSGEIDNDYKEDDPCSGGGQR